MSIILASLNENSFIGELLQHGSIRSRMLQHSQCNVFSALGVVKFCVLDPLNERKAEIEVLEIEMITAKVLSEVVLLKSVGSSLSLNSVNVAFQSRLSEIHEVHLQRSEK